MTSGLCEYPRIFSENTRSRAEKACEAPGRGGQIAGTYVGTPPAISPTALLA